MMPRKSLQQRIEQYAVSVPNSGCLIWVGYCDKDGYGITHIDGKNRRVHRLVYAEAFGEIPDGMMVCHRCDVPSCVNPDHFFLGSALENNHDMIKKGRCNPGPRDNAGVRNPNRKLAPDDIQFIRQNHKPGARKGDRSTAGLARAFSVNRTQIQKIVSGRQWAK